MKRSTLFVAASLFAVITLSVFAGQQKKPLPQDLSATGLEPPPALQIKGTGGISGRITDTSGTGLSGINVKAVSAAGYTSAALSDAAGNYEQNSDDGHDEPIHASCSGSFATRDSGPGGHVCRFRGHPGGHRARGDQLRYDLDSRKWYAFHDFRRTGR